MSRIACAIAVLAAVLARAGSLPVMDSVYRRLYPPPGPVEMRPVQGLDAHIFDGKLHLRLRDFIELVLLNSPDVELLRLNELTAAANITGAKAPFDPQLQLGWNAYRSISPGYSQIQGAQSVNNLIETGNLQYIQLLPSGQNINVQFTGARNSTNSAFTYFNPYITGLLAFNISQPLLQNRTGLQYRAPLMIARTQLLITSEQNESQIADIISADAQQYWAAVALRDAIHVSEQTLELAQKSYDRDKQALDLGALPKLDIFQSESQVASRKFDLVQARYNYKIALDGLRRLIGADLRPDTRGMEMVLEDDASTLPMRTIDPFEEALARALHDRPELSAAQRSISVDDLNADVARNQLRPQFNLNLQGGANGLGGNQIPVTGPLGTGPTTFIPGGLGDALWQVFTFDAPYYGFGFQFNLPFRNSLAQSNLSTALVNKARDRYTQRSLRQTVIQQVRQSMNNLELARASIDAGTTARDLAIKNVQAEQQKYELGGTTVFELLQAQTQLAQVQFSLLNAYITYQTSFVQYQRATWTLFDDYNIRLSHPAP
ncbi:MAG TPA: TolC family protein [Bryobacteraceae bacterium]|nr:TolC family protein [Bryobacteraceae bacterium]